MSAHEGTTAHTLASLNGSCDYCNEVRANLPQPGFSHDLAPTPPELRPPATAYVVAVLAAWGLFDVVRRMVRHG